MLGCCSEAANLEPVVPQAVDLYELAQAIVSMTRVYRPPSTCDALTFAEEARRRSIYWLASWLAQNSHL